jgi:hypothetical protein
MACWHFVADAPRTPKPVKSPQIRHRLNTPFCRVQAAARTRELAGNLPRAHHFNRPAVGFNTLAAVPEAARIPAAGPVPLPAGRRP